MTVREFLEKYCDDGLSVEISDSWYIGEETFCLVGMVKDILEKSDEHLSMKLKGVDTDIQTILILVEK